MITEQIAIICHEANRAYCTTIGDDSQKPWYALANPAAPASAQHDAWLITKQRDGWKYGEIKDAAKKEHPCIIPYSELPAEQRLKDHLFRAIVNACAGAATEA